MTPLSAALAPVAALALALASLSTSSPASPPPAGAAASVLGLDGSVVRPRPTLRGQWQWPLRPRPPVLRAFSPPATAYGAGHRGVDLAGRSGQQVLAVDTGTVSHVGVLGGRGTVTVLHATGVRSTYEPVEGAVSRGEVVARGQVLGTLAATGSHCAPRACLHVGAVRGDTYLDPLLFLAAPRVRLLPLS